MCPQTHWPMLHFTTPLHHALLQPVKLSRIRAPSKRLRFVRRPPRDGDVGRMEGEDVLFRQWNQPGAEFLPLRPGSVAMEWRPLQVCNQESLRVKKKREVSKRQSPSHLWVDR